MGKISSKQQDLYHDMKNILFSAANFELYRIVNRDGSGFLVDLAWEALRANDFTQVDLFIKFNLVGYLYNNGGGINVSIFILTQFIF